MKRAYVSPELEMVRFGAEDIIATSDEMTFDEFMSRCQQVDNADTFPDGSPCGEFYNCYVFT